jgi:hypothetical protein
MILPLETRFLLELQIRTLGSQPPLGHAALPYVVERPACGVYYAYGDSDGEGKEGKEGKAVGSSKPERHVAEPWKQCLIGKR